MYPSFYYGLLMKIQHWTLKIIFIKYWWCTDLSIASLPWIVCPCYIWFAPYRADVLEYFVSLFSKSKENIVIIIAIKTRTNCPYAATFLDICSISPPMYIYIYINAYIHIYKYIYIYIYMFYSSIFWQHFHSGCYAWKSLIIWTF